MIISIDPGDKHVGFAAWEGGELVKWAKFSPQQTIAELEPFQGLDILSRIVVESYRLYPWLAAQQGYSALLTPQLIGVIEYLGWKAGADVVEQNATIKARAFAEMEIAGFTMPKTNQHVRDAICHGWWWQHKGQGKPKKGSPRP